MSTNDEVEAALAYAELEGGNPDRAAIIDRIWQIAEVSKGDEEGQDKVHDQCERILAAEVRRLREEHEKDRAFIEAVGLLTTLKPDLVVNAADPVGMAKAVHAHVQARIAELEALYKRAQEFMTNVADAVGFAPGCDVGDMLGRSVACFRRFHEWEKKVFYENRQQLLETKCFSARAKAGNQQTQR